MVIKTILIIIQKRDVRKNIHKPMAILIVVKDSPVIHPTHHNMIDADPIYIPCTPKACFQYILHLKKQLFGDYIVLITYIEVPIPLILNLFHEYLS